MIGRIVQRIQRNLPAFAIGNAERDEAAGPLARAYFRKENVGIGLVFQHFEECHHIENFIGMLRPERFQRTTEDPCAGAEARREARRSGIEFHAGSVVAGVPRSAHKIPVPHPDIKQAAALRGERVRQEKAMAGFEGKHTRVALAIHRGIPASVRHSTWIPELQMAAGTLVKAIRNKKSPECDAQRNPCIRDKALLRGHTEKLREY